MIAAPNWTVQTWNDNKLIWVSERTGNLKLVLTGIDKLPALISAQKNTRHGTHGTMASVSVDGGSKKELGGIDSESILKEMLQGKEVLVEFYEEPTEGSKRVRLSLEGFADAWRSACEASATMDSEDRELP